MSGFVERVIEDWLTKADERSYQLSFAAYLARTGFNVRYVSPHSTLEHGKDLIATKERKIHAYQLKAGNIDKGSWRKIRDEVRECSYVPVELSGWAKRVPHRAYLVLTGRVSDSVRHEINLSNQDLVSRRYAPIELIELHELVDDFRSVFDSFLPSSIHVVHDLVRLYLRDGSEPCDKSAAADVFSSLAGSFPKKRPASRTLSDLVVAAEFSSASMQRSENHLALVDHWVLAACQLLHLAAEQAIPASAYTPFLSRCQEAIDRAADGLASEAASVEQFAEERSLLDPAFLPYRRTLVLGYLAARINARYIRGLDVRRESADLLTTVMREWPLALWSEGAWNYWLNLAIALSHSPDGTLFGEQLVATWIELVCPRAKPFPRDAYSPVADMLSMTKAVLESMGAERRDEPVSYTAVGAVAFLVRRMRRQRLAGLWPQFSRFQHASLKPDRAHDELKWHVDKGAVTLRRLPLTGSWAKLRQEAETQRNGLFAEGDMWLLPYFLSTFAHRVSPELSGELYYRASA